MIPVRLLTCVVAVATLSPIASARQTVVLEPLEAVDAEFTAVEPHTWELDGWGAFKSTAEEATAMLAVPDEASEWWDGTVLSLPPRKAVMHRIGAPLGARDRIMVSANVRLADAEGGGGRLAPFVLNHDPRLNRTVSAAPVKVGPTWERVFIQFDLGAGWPSDGDPHLQLVNVGDVPILVDKVAVSRIGTDEVGFRNLFNGIDLSGWVGNTEGYGVENGAIRTFPDRAGGNLYTAEEFDDFVFRFAFKVPPGANNGIAVRAPLGGDAAYEGMEIQVLENSHPKYAGLKPWQFHGSIYGIAPALRGYQAPPGEWNHQEIRAEGRKIRVVLNGKVINEIDLDEALRNGALSGREHPGAARSRGHLGFCGHGDVVHFADLRVRPLEKKVPAGTPAASER